MLFSRFRRYRRQEDWSDWPWELFAHGTSAYRLASIRKTVGTMFRSNHHNQKDISDANWWRTVDARTVHCKQKHRNEKKSISKFPRQTEYKFSSHFFFFFFYQIKVTHKNQVPMLMASRSEKGKGFFNFFRRWLRRSQSENTFQSDADLW